MKAQQIEAFAHGTVESGVGPGWSAAMSTPDRPTANEPLAYRGEPRSAAGGDEAAHPVFKVIGTTVRRGFPYTRDAARALPGTTGGSPRVRVPGPYPDEGRGLSGKVGCPQPIVGRKPANDYGSTSTGVACARAPSSLSNPTNSCPRAPCFVRLRVDSRLSAPR